MNPQLGDTMKTALEHYRSLPQPKRSEHLWRYSAWRRLHPTGKVDEVPKAVSAKVVLTNLDGSAVDSAIVLRPARGEERRRLSATLAEDNVAASFCRALCGDESLLLSIPNSYVGEQPLSLDITASGHISSLYLLLDIGTNVEVELAISIRGEASWFGLLREGNIGENSKLTEFVHNRLDRTSTLLRCEGVELQRDARLLTATLSSGADNSKSDLRYSLAGMGADLGVFIAVHGQGKRHDDHHIEIEHKVGNNRSQVEMHAACDDNSRSVGTGRLLIAKSAQGADAGQVFRNLLLSDKAKADVIPELEVLADDVSANHGAASAPLDPEQVFYLESRGLDKKESRDIIVEGFLMDAFRDFKSPALIDLLRTLLIVHLDCDLI